MSTSIEPAERWAVTALVVAVTVALLWPATWPLSRDSFPLSPFPMFAPPRGKPRLPQAMGLTRERVLRPLPPQLVANAEVMQAAQALAHGIRGGQARTLKLCAEIAARVAQAPAPAYSDVAAVVIVSEKVDAVAYFTGRAAAEGRQIHGRCMVERE